MRAFGFTWIAVLAFLWATAAMPALAQAPAPATPPAPTGGASEPSTTENLNVLQELANKTGVVIGIAVSLLVSLAGLVVALTKLYNEQAMLFKARNEMEMARQELDKTRGDLDAERKFFAGGILKAEPQALTAERKGIDYQIVLLGEGNTGKTTFVRMLSHNPKADVRSKTGDSQTFGFSLTSYEPGNWESIRFLVDDYRGQTPGALADSPSLRGVTAENPRAGAAVFMLDICETDAGTGKMKKGVKLNDEKTFSPARLRRHVADWSVKDLDNLQTHLRGRVRFNYVCCFINKIDLAAQWTVAEEEAIRAELKDLFGEIQSFPMFNTGCEHDIIFGTLAVNEHLDGPKRRARLSVGCNLPLLWSKLVARARLAALPGAPQEA